MNALIFYFSGTGNTKMVAEKYAEALKGNGATVTLCALPAEQNGIASASDYDTIGIGYPIHAFNAPKIILSLCKSLPKIEKTAARKKVFIFKTSGEPVRMSDASSLKMRSLLKRRGYTVTNEYQYIMPYNIIFRHSDGMANKMWETAKALIPVDAKEITDGVSRLPKKIFMGGFVAWILRAEHWGAHIIGKLYSVKKKKCVGCGLCERVCPVHNIKIVRRADGSVKKIKFGGKCIMCMRCAFLCPKSAVELGLLKTWKVNGKYDFDKPEDNPRLTASGKHNNYCKKAYRKYFENAEKRMRNS